MNESLLIQELPAADISELLNAEPGRLPRCQATALDEFIRQIGGIENAWAAVEMLNELEKNG